MIPFITEEIWHALYDGKPPARSIALTSYPGSNEVPLVLFGEMSHLQNLIGNVRTMRKDMGVPEKEVVPITVYPFTDFVRQAFSENQDIIQKLARVSNIELSNSQLEGPGVFRYLSYYEVKINYQAAERTVDIPAERDRLTKDIAKYEKGLMSAERQLGNEVFLSKAPPQVVEGLKKQEAETRLLLEKARAALAALPSE